MSKRNRDRQSAPPGGSRCLSTLCQPALDRDPHVPDILREGSGHGLGSFPWRLALQSIASYLCATLLAPRQFCEKNLSGSKCT